jgi:hypothetical protein
MIHRSFNEYILFLRDTLYNLVEYRQKIGHPHLRVKAIYKDLSNADPFILYQASLAATLLLEDASIYH